MRHWRGKDFDFLTCYNHVYSNVVYFFHLIVLSGLLDLGCLSQDLGNFLGL